MKPAERKLTFGIHNGKQLQDVPLTYLDFLLGLSNLGPSLRYDIEAYLKTQAAYDQLNDTPKDWREGREDYNQDEDD